MTTLVRLLSVNKFQPRPGNEQLSSLSFLAISYGEVNKKDEGTLVTLNEVNIQQDRGHLVTLV